MSNQEWTTNFFNSRFDSIEKEIPYDPAWNNNTGYFDGATKIELAPGEEAKSVTPAPNNRKIIFMGTQLGTAVFFERYTDGANGVITRNLPRRLENVGVIPTGQLSYDVLSNIFSYGSSDNLGSRLARYFRVDPGVNEDDDE